MPDRRGIGRSLLLTLPMALWSMLMFSRSLRAPGVAVKLAALTTGLFMVALFFMMMRTRQTHRWRRVFFIALGFLFPVGFIWGLISLRGSMNIPMEQMLAGETPFCFLAIPMMLIPAALWKTIIFPGSVLPQAGNPSDVASINQCRDADLPVAVVMGGGYAKNLQDTVEIQLETVRIAAETHNASTRCCSAGNSSPVGGRLAAGSGDGVGKMTMESTGNGLHLISMVLFMAAAAFVYLFLLNRVLIQIRDARRKSLLIRAGGLLSVAVAGALGYFAAGTAWMLVPAAILAATALGEVRRLIVRRRCAGAPPVEVKTAAYRGGNPTRRPIWRSRATS